MPKFRHTSLVIVVGALLASGCCDNDTVAPGAACDEHEDCTPGLSCKYCPECEGNICTRICSNLRQCEDVGFIAPACTATAGWVDTICTETAPRSD